MIPFKIKFTAAYKSLLFLSYLKCGRMTGSSRELVALFKSADEKASIDDRYFSMLEENNFSGILVPTLSFQFQLSNLKECLFQPEKYSGVPMKVLCVFFNNLLASCLHDLLDSRNHIDESEVCRICKSSR